ncbi:RHS repeat domain-containing protein [Tenacibaculum sp. FZY0031]|uniref:RHS repeat domain-containing protein n=1 Tax=Tenacibaculum sp. FZY0031 TaxID=3116648 RepID=UPI002EC635E0|nr:RHS repeat domain-containing protein [Tenacibaculum sp. FZY0031]
MKKNMLGILVMLYSFTFYGQYSSSFGLPNVVPPSPEASALSKFINIPISHYTGLPNISIPIYTISEKGIQIPISLSYHARGIKVSEVASRTGSNWSLIYGGSISRQVRGKADDTGYNNGYLKNKTEFLTYASNLQTRQNVQSREDLDPGYDFYPDQFSFNAGATSGKFILNYENEQPLIQSFDDVTVTFEKENGKIASFKVIDSQGNTFYYGVSKDGLRTAREYQTSIGWSIYFDGNVVDDPASTSSEIIYNSWKLMDIETPYGELISYNYNNIGNFVNYNKSYDKHDVTGTQVTNTSSGMGDIKKINTRLTKTNNYSQELESITFSKGKIVFTKSTALREDYNGHSLDKIAIYDVNDTLLKAFKLNYSYTTSTDQNNVLNYIKSSSLIFDKSLKRLFLSSVEEESKTGQKLPPYQFTYNPTVLPSRFSTSQDYWGYYNGADNGPFLRMFEYGLYKPDRRVNPEKSEAGLLKEITHPTGGKTKFTYEDNIGFAPPFLASVKVPAINPEEENDTNYVFTKSDFLTPAGSYETKTLSIPDGAVTFKAECMHLRDIDDTTTPDCLFEFAVNNGPVDINTEVTFNSGVSNTITISVYVPRHPGVDPNLHLDNKYDFRIVVDVKKSFETGSRQIYAGGKRIKKIETITEGKTTVKEYEYGINLNVGDEFSSGSSGFVNGLPEYINTSKYNEFQTLTHYYTSSSSYGSFQPNSIGYTEVTEYHGTKDNNLGKTEYVFTNFEDSRDDYYEFPYYPPTDNEWLRGKNIKTKVYGKTSGGSNYKLLKEIYNKYTYGNVVYLNDFLYRGLIHIDDPAFVFMPKSKSYEWVENDNTVQIEKNSTSFKVPFFMRQRYDSNFPSNTPGYRIYYLTGGTVNLDYSIETSYFDSGSTETITNYFYNYDKHYQLSKTKRTHSNGDVILNETIYPQDKVSGLTAAEQSLVNSHRFTPIESYSFKDIDSDNIRDRNEVLSYQKTEYINDNGSGITLPSIVKTLKGVAGTSNAIQDRVVYHKYDSKGNPTEVSKKDGTKIYYLWGYQQTQPIAKIENYTDTELANIQSLIDAAVSASNNDTDTASENNLRTALNHIRNNANMVNSQITTFTYDPLIGVTSITDPRGQTIYYEYDDFNRLKFIKDTDGNLLKEHKYNYKN